MGCSASKEDAVATKTSAAPAPAPAVRRPTGKLAEQSNGTSGNSSRALPPAAKPPTGSTGSSTNGDHDPTRIMVMDLNDVVPPADSEPQGRSRFLSYASGASTPNTSQGNISWDGNSDSGDGSQRKTQSPDEKKRKNPKVLRSSGSAIGLDELHNNDGAGLTSKVVHIEVPFGKPIEEVYEGVHNGPVLGSGVSGIVRLVTHKATGVEYAVKCLDLGLVGTKEGLTQLREEIFIMCQLDHPNIVRLEEVYESHSEIYLVQELCLGGELFDRLDQQPDYHYTEAECARLVKQMLSAVRYLHSKGIIHRDLKLENFLFSSKSADSELKMIDFGLSKHFQFGEVHHEAVGTPYTVAPEVIEGSYDERCDIWAIGVITFLLLSGDPPFGGCGGPEPLLTVRANILACKYHFEPEDIWGLVSGKGKDFVKAMLVVDPKKRPTAREAQKDPWLKEWASRASTKDDKVLNPNVVKALVCFKEFSHMRKLLSEVLSFTLLPDQIKELRKEFEKMDTDGSGEISLTGLKQVLVTNAGAGSLGALTEEEVEDIFNAMRVNKAETRIHWHEFIAAGLSQCRVDDRNLRLAFDRLDSDHKGYISLDDIMNLVGNDELHTEEQLRSLWKDSMRSVNCTSQHIAYDQFLRLMKGQTKDPDLPMPSVRLASLGSVPEGESTIEEGMPEDDPSMPPRVAKIEDSKPHLLVPAGDSDSLASLPNMTSPAMYDTSSSTLGGVSSSPIHDSPIEGKKITELGNPASTIPELAGSPGSKLVRGRSKSLADETESFVPPEAPFQKDTRRAIALPERDPKVSQELAGQSTLAVSRQLYRAHRQMRLSVLDASRRFEEEQARRARDTLMAEKAKEAGLMGLGQAGLVMRHGLKVHVTTDAIREYLEKYRAEQQQLVEKATRRGGRGRGNRKKTISDMSAMMNPSLGQDEMTMIAAKAAQSPDASKLILNSSFTNFASVPELPKTTRPLPLPPKLPKAVLPPVDVVDKSVRKPTIPGQFHHTKDPFSMDGMYGGARINAVDVNQIKSGTTDATTPDKPKGKKSTNP